MAPKPSAEVLPGVPKHKKAAMCLPGKHVLGKPGSGMSHRAAGCELSITESAYMPQRCLPTEMRITQGHVLTGAEAHRNLTGFSPGAEAQGLPHSVLSSRQGLCLELSCLLGSARMLQQWR